MRLFHTSCSLFAIATCFIATSAIAQEAPPVADPAAPTSVAADEIDDIVVTAQRRSENLQDVPLSVATVSSQTLAAINSGGATCAACPGECRA